MLRASAGRVIRACGFGVTIFALVRLGPAQSAGPAFDVASVKLSKGPAGLVRIYPGRFTAAGTNVLGLVAGAYQLPRYQVLGGPDWARSERYDVEGKAEGQASREDVLLMARSMLNERFGFKFHWEPKEVSVYALVVAKGGPKLRRVEPDEKVPAASAKPHQMRLRVDMTGLANGLYGLLQVTPEIPETGSLLARGTVLPVVDQTRLEGAYDVVLDMTPDPDGDTFTVCQRALRQLGLEMLPRKGTIEYLVVDSVERPSEN